jgi:hypothetical protein
MTASDRLIGGSVRRSLAVFAAVALTVTLLPLAAFAQGSDVPNTVCPDPPEAPFADRDQIAEAHRRNVDCAFDLGITVGVIAPDTQRFFLPLNNITRAQFAGFLHRTLTLFEDSLETPFPEPQRPRFPDVPEGHTFDDEIHVLAAADIILGFADGTFGPNDLIKRDQTASLLLRAAEWATGVDMTAQASGYFVDTATSFHRDNIDAAFEAGLVQGVRAPPAGEYRPFDFTLRMQMATVMVRFADLLHQFFEEVVETPPPAAAVDIQPTEVDAGDTITVTVVGEDITHIAISGPCIVDEEHDVEPGEDPYTFELQVDVETPAPSECVITVTVTFADGTTEVIEITIMIVGPLVFTDAPELIRVEPVSVGVTNTTVRFVFDSELAAVRTPPAPGAFHLHTWDGVNHNATDAELEAADPTGRSVIATFLTTQFDAATAGAVDFGAVADEAGRENPEGGKRLKAVTLEAGATLDPDLLAVTVTAEQVNGDWFVRANYVFDEPVDPGDVGAAADYRLILQAGATEETGDDIVPTPAQPQLVSVRFAATPNTQAGADALVAAAKRGYVTEANAISDVLKVASIGDGLTAGPDLISVEFRAGVEVPQPPPLPPTAEDQVVFTFDATLTATPGPAVSFCIYYRDASVICGDDPELTVAMTGAQEVTLRAPAGTVSEVVAGAFVRQGAVTAAGTLFVNMPDEMGRAFTFAAGQTLAPVLESVAIVGANIVFTFDKAPSSINAANFNGYEAVQVAANRQHPLANCTLVGLTVECDDVADVTIVGGGIERAAVTRDVVTSAGVETPAVNYADSEPVAEPE